MAAILDIEETILGDMEETFVPRMDAHTNNIFNFLTLYDSNFLVRAVKIALFFSQKWLLLNWFRNSYFSLIGSVWEVLIVFIFKSMYLKRYIHSKKKYYAIMDLHTYPLYIF